MDKNAIKKYAVWARRELIARVSQKAAFYGITEQDCGDATAESINGKVLTPTEKQQRQGLIAEIKQKGYQEVMEEVAYTWFNRFSALRFMEVNSYLPTHVRVFSDEENNFKPQILAEAIHLEMDGLDMDKVYELKEADKTDELYKYLLTAQCNALNVILPGMFQKISDYTELLFPENLLREGSVIEQMISLIPEEDWKDAVQIIGWLYQYYNAEKKDDVFAALKKNVKITKENIPAATQLFTPDWIVWYMVENSLGRLWVEGHPNDELKAGWKYYLDEAEQEADVQKQLEDIHKEYAGLKPEDIKCIDPCCGSGHILAYMFDVLVQIYEAYGYITREAVASIVENNIYGLDIDDRAAQLANFAVMMKARQYDRRFFTRGIQPKVYAIQESNNIDPHMVEYFWNGDSRLEKAINYVIRELHDAKEYGSILNATLLDFAALYKRFDEIRNDIHMYRDAVLRELLPLVQIAEILAQKYNVVVTNPPYMTSYNMTAKLNGYLRKCYPEGKNDLFSAFILKCAKMTRKNGFQSMITMHSWMFLSRYKDLRRQILNGNIENMLHLGAHAFDDIGGEVVQTVSFVFRNVYLEKYIGRYEKLTDYNDSLSKKNNVFTKENNFYASQYNFMHMVDFILAYWVSSNTLKHFAETKLLGESADCRQGIATGNNDIFLRFWFEISNSKVNYFASSQEDMNESGKLYVPYNKGGSYRRWYGNHEYVIKIDSIYYEKLLLSGNHLPSRQMYYKEGITWNDVSTTLYCARIVNAGFVFDAAGPTCFYNGDKYYLLGFLNSCVTQNFLSVICQGLHYSTGHIPNIPFIVAKEDTVVKYTKECIDLSINDWNSFETSWDFLCTPLISTISKHRMLFDDISNIDLAECFMVWKNECNERFNQLKANEEELNRIFIDIYGLQDELMPEVEDKDVTVRKADLQRDIKSLISYAVGCMFGRYSLNEPGLAYAGGEWNPEKYQTYPADKDNIIPICDDEYFADDIVGRFVKFIETVYGKKSLDSNLRFIADALGGKGQPIDIIRSYFMNDFYADHCKIYQKRPIYWQFDSGKKNGFKCLIYMHRYQLDTIARIRTDYVHEQQSRYRTAISDLETRIANAATSEQIKLNKQLKKLQDQSDEIHVYEEKIHHLADQMISIDLDDGVKVNYAKFQDVLAKIK